MPDNQPHMNKHEDEGTVIQAMRGWPDKSKMQQEQEEEEYGYSNSRPVDQVSLHTNTAVQYCSSAKPRCSIFKQIQSS